MDSSKNFVTMKSSNKSTVADIKFSQLQAAFKRNLNELYFEEIIKCDFNINHRIVEYDSKGHKFKIITALHLAFDHKRIRIFNLLLCYGADILTDDNVSTVLQKAFQECYEEGKNSLKSTILPFVQSALAAHVDSKILANPMNKYGISHFHAACITNDVRAVEFFLSMGVSVNRAIVLWSPVLPGYTCLHLAARYYASETVELLLKHKASLNVRDRAGMTSMQLLVHRKIELHDSINNGKTTLDEAATKELEASDRILRLLLESDPADSFYPHAACTLANSALAERLLRPVVALDCPVDSASRWWPGYTPPHFAAHCNVDTLLLLLGRGADVGAKEAGRGLTPFDLCLSRHGAECVHSVIASQPSWKSVAMSDRKTKLREVVLAMRDPAEFEALLRKVKPSARVPDFSPLWPGSSLLHLAVYFAKHHHLALVEACLSRGADVTARDSRGWTPILLAFRQNKVRTGKLLLQHQRSLENPSDADGLSHLHVACALKDKDLAERLASGGADLEMAYRGKLFCSLVKQGATPLHVAVASESCEIAGMLLRWGADLQALDGSSLTPIHRLFAAKSAKALGGVLLSQPNLKDRALAIGLNYLHAACHVGHVDAARRLLELGADINGAVTHGLPSRSGFGKFAGFTPLRFAVENDCGEVARLLVDRGADILPLFYRNLASPNAKFYEFFVSAMKNNFASQRRMTDDCGMTMLHVACHSLDLELAEHLLEVGLSVNAQIQPASTIWPYCTPLHVLVKRFESHYDRLQDTYNQGGKYDRMLQILLDNGADVTIVDADDKTPVHLVLESFEQDDPEQEDYNRLSRLLKSHKDFRVNPATAEGISHFHVACLINDATIAEQFLKNGVDVNESVDGFSSDFYAGCTALHMSAGSYMAVMSGFAAQLETIDLLLKYGADIHARDACENTPIHSAAECSLILHDVDIFEKLVRAGADILSENVRKETPFECLLRLDSATLGLLDFFIKNGYRLNTFKPITEEGILGQTFCSAGTLCIFDILTKLPDVVQVDEMNRTLIHNIVSFASEEHTMLPYSNVIEKLIQMSCDVDAKDRFGKTALHRAVEFHNRDAVFGLLDNGADMNVADFGGKSAFIYSLQPCEACDDSEYLMQQRKKIIILFMTHVMKLRECKLYVSSVNQSVQTAALGSVSYDTGVLQTTRNELSEMKSAKVGSSRFVLYDFLSETGAVAVYPSTPQLERIEINKFFESRDRPFPHTGCLLKLQHKKAIMRWKLNVDATSALRNLLQFSLPELCCWMIFRFLGNADLESLIESVIEVKSEDVKMCID